MPTFAATLRPLDSTDSQSVALSRDLWKILNGDSNSNAFSVSISVPSLSTQTPTETPSFTQPSFLAFATFSEDERPNTVYASTDLLKSVYGQGCRLEEEDDWPATIEPVQLIELDELIVAALDSSSYTFAQQDQQGLAAMFSQPNLLIRSGGIYDFGNYHFKVLMSNPVQQGYMRTTETTNLFVVDLVSQAPETKQTEQVLMAPLNMLDIHDTPELAVPQEFKAQISPAAWPESRLFPVPLATEDTESRVFVNIKDLGRCGVFSGDWVLVAANDSTKSRLCRIYGIDDNQVQAKSELDTLLLSPLLYFNLGLPLPPSSVEDNVVTITRLTVTPTPPMASAVTIARIASPSSMDKSLQTAFLEALKQWFEARERIVCKGDVLAIPLDEENARLRPKEEDEQADALVRKPTTLAYFKVTSLEEPTESNGVHPSYYGHGRKINPSQTKMVQTGVEQSRIPAGHLSRYYDFLSQLPLERPTTSAYRNLHELVSSSLHPLGRDFELSCNVLLLGPRGGGKATLVKQVAEALGVHLFEFAAYDVVAETDAKTEVHMRAKVEKAAALAPCIVLVRGIEALARKTAVVETGQEPLLATVLQECIQSVNAAYASSGYPVMVVATTSDIDALPTSILACFRHEVSMEAPDEKTRLSMLKNLTSSCPLAPDVSLKSLATQTAALVSKDLVDLVARTGVLALQRIHKSVYGEEKNGSRTQDIKAAGVALTAADFDGALNEARASYSDSIGAPKIPNVTWDDVGGLANVKDDILDTIQLPLEHPELFGSGLKKRSGILLYGPPGTGKTLLAKAIATSCSLNFFSVKGPELLNMYIGESEANVRRVFQRARDAKPCVIFFDELDSVAPKRGEKGDSGGVMDRIVSQMLAELDGMSEGGEEAGVGDVFVIGATNRPDLLDPALLRPGRFDKLLYLGVSETHESQLRIIQALSRKFRLHPDLDLARVAEKCPFHYTGADFYALCSDAMLKAMTRVADAIEDKVKALNAEKRPGLPDVVTAQYYLSHLATPEDIVVQVEEVDFVKALEELIPSVSATELAHYSKVREKFEQVKEEEEEDVEVEPKKDKGKGKQKA
ncbi:P-loop containing nucleoside triphosphate hydrolase protein [Phycomyces nitens]|nr:P-loop containing nucleoside triphosphate hydrolase protein [Phycomyces nitens]